MFIKFFPQCLEYFFRTLCQTMLALTYKNMQTVRFHTISSLFAESSTSLTFLIMRIKSGYKRRKIRSFLLKDFMLIYIYSHKVAVPFANITTESYMCFIRHEYPSGPGVVAKVSN